MYEFYIVGYETCNDPYYYNSDYPVDITVTANTLTEAIEKAEKVLECKIHRRTMRYEVKEMVGESNG